MKNSLGQKVRFGEYMLYIYIPLTLLKVKVEI